MTPKLSAILATAFILAGCSSMGNAGYINVATGVDSNGNVVIERHRLSAPPSVPAASLSTYNPYDRGVF